MRASGVVDQEVGEPRAALVHFERALELWPGNTAARFHASLMHRELGNVSVAPACWCAPVSLLLVCANISAALVAVCMDACVVVCKGLALLCEGH